jgi:hypothetical protein
MVQPAMMICANDSICAFGGVSTLRQWAMLAACLTERAGAGAVVI